uniref:Uncharacterized protein n=1 Tax=Chrysotila carterae TaxID=13221 RepID=A0A7S4B5M1_CHRCT
MAPLACARAEAAGFAPVGFKGFRFKEADFTLGAAFGDMELCLNVCLAISGCNLVVTEGDNLFGSVPSRCHLSTRCVHASSQQWMQGSSASASNVTSALPTCGRALAAKTCRDMRKWNYLAHRSRNEETHLEYVTGSEADCKRECERSASCNGFRRDLYGRRGCQLFTGCNDPTAPAETLIKPGGGRSFTTYYMWPCVKETSIFPLPGIRRTVPPGKPTGLATFECRSDAECRRTRACNLAGP